LTCRKLVSRFDRALQLLEKNAAPMHQQCGVPTWDQLDVARPDNFGLWIGL
jgi:hypothetical protein